MRLSNSISLFALAVFAVLGVAGWGVLGSYRESFDRQVQTAEMEHGGTALRIVIGRVLEREWTSLKAFSDNVDTSSLQQMQRLTDTAAAASKKIDWVGVISPQGIIEAASGGEQIGQDVSQEPWFQWGVQHPMITEPIRHVVNGRVTEGINLVQPIGGEGGSAQGLVVYRLSLDWLRGYITETAAALGVDAFVVDPSGEVLISATSHSTAPPTSTALQAARLNLLRGYTPIESQQPGYVNASIPRALGDQVPNNGWSLIVRMPDQLPETAGSPAWQKAQTAFLVLLLVGAVTMVAAIRAFARPIEALADTLTDFAHGKFTYPREYRSSEEARKLGSALALIQSELETVPGKHAPAETAPTTGPAAKRPKERSLTLVTGGVGGQDTPSQGDPTSNDPSPRHRGSSR